VREGRVTLGKLGARLDAMSPLKVLGRGYAIATRAADGRAVRAAGELTRGDVVRVRVGDGAFEAEVSRVESGDRDRDGGGA
jgi:exodeoxyribonuclease VII large subunit